MKQIGGININGNLYRYSGITYQMECGIIVSFQNGAHKWDGIYPGKSWDQFYNELSLLNIELLTPHIISKRLREPLFMWAFKIPGICQRCEEPTTSKFCSIDCWYFDTLEMIRQAIETAPYLTDVEANVRFMERVIRKYGPLIKFGSDAECAS